MMILEQNATNTKELSSVLLWIGMILILISVILPLFIYGIVSIENIEMLSGINIDVEQLNITYILLAAFVISWFLYWQGTKVNANRIMLIKQMDKRINATREQFFKNIACPNVRDCFDVKYCYITEKDDVLESKNNCLFRRYKNIEVYGVAYRYENYYADSKHNVEAASEAEIAKIKQEGWQLVEKNSNADSRIDPIFTKVFEYNPLKLKFILFWGKLRFKSTGTYLISYTIAHCCAGVSAVLTVILIV